MMNMDKALQMAEDWDIKNKAMQPISIPDGYKVKYLYKQPVVYFEDKTKNLPSDLIYTVNDGWGIISIESEHQLNKEELKKYQDIINKNDIICIGGLRLVKQTFFYNKNRK